jgi:hypothetical protein
MTLGGRAGRFPFEARGDTRFPLFRSILGADRTSLARGENASIIVESTHVVFRPKPPRK